MNNIIEQDHRFIKKRHTASLEFRSAEAASQTIERYEAMSSATVSSSTPSSVSLHSSVPGSLSTYLIRLPLFATEPENTLTCGCLVAVGEKLSPGRST
jgi:hypothetical protein